MTLERKEKVNTDTVWVLLGPTAAGKTFFSLELAQRIKTQDIEVVSVDSMQVYRGMDIGTAKVSPEQREKVPHHMIDVVDPSECFNAARFCEMALEAISNIQGRGKRALLTCGTPFYLKALLWGMFDGPGACAPLRARLRKEARERGTAFLHERLSRIDPKAAENINKNDYKRIERALEVHESTGKPISEQQGGFDGPPQVPAEFACLQWPREQLYARIEQRVDKMIEEGLIEEVETLRDHLGPQAAQAVGYKEIISYLDGKISLDEAIESVQRNTRHFAKDQIGWFKRFPVKHWIPLDNDSDREQKLQKLGLLFSQE